MRKSFKKDGIGEAFIKAAVLNRLRQLGRIDRRSTLANEFCLGRTGVRADLAIRSDRLIGVEIKSELDSLRRLPNQLAAYRSLFDCTILVVATCHLMALKKMDLGGVEIWEFTSDGTLGVVQAENSELRPEPNWASMMTQVERRRFLANDGQKAFRAAFDHRFAITSQAFWRTIGRRKIKAVDLALLSRFREIRALQAAADEAREARWSKFIEQVRRLTEPSDTNQAA